MKKTINILSSFLLAFLLLSCSTKNQQNNNFASLQDVVDAKKSIGVVTGTTHDEFVNKNYPEAEVLHFEGNPDLIIALNAGQVEAVVGDQNILKPYLKADPNLVVLEKRLFNQYFGYGFGDAKLKDAFNVYLAKLRESKELDKIIDKWENAEENTKLNEYEFSGENGLLRIGITGVSIPFAYLSHGNYVGIDMELIYGFAESQGMKPELHTMQFNSLIASIVSKKVDIIGSPVTITEERKKQILFSDSYYTSASIAVTLKKNITGEKQALNLEKKEDLYNKRIGVLLGSVQDIFATKNFPEATILRMNTITEMVPLLQQNQCDAAFLDDIRADFLLKEYPEFAYLDDAVLKSSCAVGFPKSKTKVRDEFNIFLKEIRENGIYDEMYDRWIINGDESVMPLIENTGTNGTIRIGSTFESIPFSFMKNNEYYGFDVELMLRYAASLNKKPVFSDYNFSGLLAAAATEKVDVIAASIMATEERAKQIAFSDNYFTGHSGLIVLSENLAGNNNKTNAPSKNKKKQKEESYFTSLNDVAKKRIAVMVGSTHDQFISSNYPNATIVRIDNAPDLTLALKTGQCDAIVLDENTAKLYLEADNQLGVLERDIFKEEYGFGFNNQELRDDVNIYLNELISSGQNQLIIEKWSNDDGSMQIPDFNNKGENGTLKIGTTGTDIPFSYIKENKDAGIDMEIIYGYAASKGLKPEVSIMPFGSLLAAATSKKVDVIVSAITITEERKKQLFFSDTYYGSNAIALTLKKNLPPEERSSGLNLRTVDDLQDKRIGVLLGSAQDMFVSSKFKNAELYRMDHSVDLVALLQQGQCDAILLNDIEAIYLMAEHPEFAYLQKNVSKESYVIGFPKSATKERDEFNVFLKDIKDSGLYDEIYNRWIFNANEAVMPMIENDGKNGILKVGTTLEEVPYSFIKNGEYAGFDIELMLRYAAYINKKAEFIHYNFSGMLAAVISDKVDVIANAIMETEERAKNISFSNEYIDVPSGIIVLNKNLASSQDDEKESKSWFTRVKESFHNNIIKEKRYLLLWDGLKVTFIISVLSAILGTLLGALICWMRMSKNKIVKTIALVYIDILRGIPQVVLLMLMFYVVFASWNIGGVAVAVITFAMNFAAYVSEMFRTSIQSIKKGQTEAGIAMGFSKVKTFFNIIMPQAIQRVIPVYKGEFIGLVKMTSIVGYIAVQDLTKASDIIRSRTFDAFFPLIVISIIYFLLAWLLTLLIDMIQIKVAPKRK